MLTRIIRDIETMGTPWPGGLVGWSVVPYIQNVAGLIPGQGTYLGCGFDPQVGHVRLIGKQLMFLSHIDVFSVSLPLSKRSVNIFSGEDFLKILIKIRTNEKWKELGKKMYRIIWIVQFLPVSDKKKPGTQ